jgi:hypothetical protein
LRVQVEKTEFAPWDRSAFGAKPSFWNGAEAATFEALSHLPNFVLDNQIRFGMGRTREAKEYRAAPPKTIRSKRG